MMAVAVGLGCFVVLVGLAACAGSRDGAAPRVAAGAYVVSLLGWAILPSVWLGCLGSALGSWLGGIRTSGGGCLFSLDHGQWQLLGDVPGALVLGVLVFSGLRHAAAARRAELRGLALAGSLRRPTSAGEVWVVPSAHPMAFASGLWRCRAVVTTGMLAPLSSAERQAVCEHEAAHVRLGHPRLLVVCGAIAAAYGRFPPVRWAWERLRRELESAADDEAARVVGAEVLLAALVHATTLADRSARALESEPGDAEHLCWRMARLAQSRSSARWPTLVVGSAGIATGGAMAIVGCVLMGAPASVGAELACLAVVALFGLRPVWGGWRPRTDEVHG
jgi:Zn-dependent protease with chaperone function